MESCDGHFMICVLCAYFYKTDLRLTVSGQTKIMTTEG